MQTRLPVTVAIVYVIIEGGSLFGFGRRIEAIDLKFGDVPDARSDADGQDEEEDDYEPDSSH